MKKAFISFATLPPGQYRWRISFIGYVSRENSINVDANTSSTITISLEPDFELIGEVLVESERTTGVARINAGRQRIRPSEIEIIPAPDISADLAGYLTTLPGVVVQGDRGGAVVYPRRRTTSKSDPIGWNDCVPAFSRVGLLFRISCRNHKHH